MPLIILRSGSPTPSNLPFPAELMGDRERQVQGGNALNRMDDAEEAPGEDDDEDSSVRKVAAQTVATLQYLYMHNRISKQEKQLLTADLIHHANQGSFSKIEIAMMVLICGVRPSDAISVSVIPKDFSTISTDDLEDFEEICHRVSRELSEV